MTEEDFWQLIDESRRDFDPGLRDGNMQRQMANLRSCLEELPSEAVRDFDQVFESVLRRANTWSLWAAAYVIGQGCSDDWFDDFRNWLVSMGRDVFEDALRDPESLVDASQRPGVEDVFFEGFNSVSNSVLEERPDLVEESKPDWPEEPEGERWEAHELSTRFPKRWAVYGESEV